MLRPIHQFVIRAALLTLFFSTSAVNAQASASPCAAHEGKVDATACSKFRAYVQDSIQQWNESTAMNIPESTMSRQPVSVDTLRAAKPDFTGGFVPEAIISRESVSSVPNWDHNNVADIPESSMLVSLEELLGLLKAPDVGK